MYNLTKSEKCPACNGRSILCNEHPHDSSFSGFLKCTRCNGTGLITRELTLEERVERLEKMFDMIFKPVIKQNEQP